jgi:hypothetical protein
VARRVNRGEEMESDRSVGDVCTEIDGGSNANDLEEDRWRDR